MSKANNKIQLFENQPMRVIWDEEQEKYWFSVVDIIAALTEQPDYRLATKYWNTTKTRLLAEGSQLSTNCGQLKILYTKGSADLAEPTGNGLLPVGSAKKSLTKFDIGLAKTTPA